MGSVYRGSVEKSYETAIIPHSWILLIEFKIILAKYCSNVGNDIVETWLTSSFMKLRGEADSDSFQQSLNNGHENVTAKTDLEKVSLVHVKWPNSRSKM